MKKKNVFPKESDLTKSNAVSINEIFYSIQGESSYVGWPCIFIRFAECNLRCSWCDTKYAWKNNSGKSFTFKDIEKKIKSYPAKLIQITGGEPLLQKNSLALIEYLQNKGYTVLLETNGSLSIKDLPDITIIMDIKCPSSGEHKKLFKNNLKLVKAKIEYKFIIQNKNDFKYMISIVNKYKLESKGLVLAGPVSRKLKPKILAKWILKSGKKIRLNMQIHKVIWKENKRGV